MEMVVRWVIFEETKPEPIMLVKYPNEIMKKNAPASLWLIFRSCSMLGRSGAKMILDTKFR